VSSYVECSHAECSYSDCNYAECSYAECLGATKDPPNLVFENVNCT
jgi:hypothetical protein